MKMLKRKKDVHYRLSWRPDSDVVCCSSCTHRRRLTVWGVKDEEGDPRLLRCKILGVLPGERYAIKHDHICDEWKAVSTPL